MDKPATRLVARGILGELTPTAKKSILLSLLCLGLAVAGAFWPSYDGLSEQGVLALFVLLFCAGLWVTEAMPAFAVSLLAIGLEIALLGRVAAEDSDWEKYIATWGSPLVWLFFGGFVLAAGAKKTQLDQWMAVQVLSRLGSKPAIVLGGVMAATAILSMFISNTATATMMVAVLGPWIASAGDNQRHVRALLLGVATAANIGGMGTIVGTPPNAIAAGVLEPLGGVNFAEWMIFGVPPAVVLLLLVWFYLTARYLRLDGFVKDENLVFGDASPAGSVPEIQQAFVAVTFAITTLMWLTSPWHGIPTTVVSFIPICLLTTTRILDADDVKSISWDVLLLIAGGLSLGVAVRDTGLAEWLIAQLPVDGLSAVAIAISLAYIATALSNLMSNTAAANVILPLAFALLGTIGSHYVIPIALAASSAMCLPISTPPNAIVYGTRKLKSLELLEVGLLIGVVTPLIVVGWTTLVARMEWVLVRP